jgi:hypothetical protein
MNGEGKVLGYFFGPKRERIPRLSDTTKLRPADAVHIRFFGDLGLIDRKWTILGKSELWQRASWPMPAFCRHFELDTHAYRVEYSEETLAVIDETEVSPEECQQMPRDGLSGFGAIEITLTKLVST